MTASNSAEDPVSGVQTRTALVVIVVLFAALIVFLSWALRILLIDILLALTLASAIAPIADWCQRKHIARLAAVIITYVSTILFYAAIAVSLAQPVREQAALFWQQAPQYLSGVNDFYQQALTLAGERAEMITVAPGDLRLLGLNLIHHTLDITAGLMGLILNGIFVLFLAAYFVIEAGHIWASLLLWIPCEHRQRAGSLIAPLAGRMGGYVRGQILVSTAVSAFLATGLTLLGVRYGLILGLLAGLLNLLPFVGSLLTAVLATLVAANQSALLAFLTVGLFLLEQTVESNFIVPHLLGKQVDLHPLIVLFSIIIGATLAGGPGALVAVPLTTALLFLAQEFYFKPLNTLTPDSGPPVSTS